MRTNKHVLTIKELGQMYFPNSTSKSAGTQLVRWIKYNKYLWQELIEAGYSKGQRLMTPRQVGLIFQYLGEP